MNLTVIAVNMILRSVKLFFFLFKFKDRYFSEKIMTVRDRAKAIGVGKSSFSKKFKTFKILTNYR